MRRIAAWVIVVGMVIGVAVPEVAYACMPSPPYWEVKISDLQHPYIELPDGLRFTSTAKSLEIENLTDQPAALLVPRLRNKVIEPNSTYLVTESDLYRTLFPSNYGDNSADFTAPYYEDDVEQPPLIDKIELLLKHDGQEYSIPITAYYNIKYVPSDGGAGCLGVFSLFVIPIVAPLIIGVILITIIVAAVRNVIKSRRGAP